MSPNWLSIPEAASLTGLPEDHLRAAVVMGELSAEPTGNLKEYRVRREDLVRYAQERGISIRETPPRSACCRFSAVRTLVAMGLIGFSLILLLSFAHRFADRPRCGGAFGCSRESFIMPASFLDLLKEAESLTDVYPQDLGSVPDAELDELIEVWADLVARIEKEPEAGVAPLHENMLDFARRNFLEAWAEQLRRSF